MPNINTMIHLHRVLLLFGLWFCIPQLAMAQSKPASDSVLCKAYMDSIKLYTFRFDANDSLRYYGQQLLALGKKYKFVEYELEALSVIGITYARTNENDKALEIFELNRQRALETGRDTIAAQVMLNIASIYTVKDSSQKAMSLLMESAKIFEAMKDSNMLSYAYTNIGILFGKIKERDRQLAYSKKAFAMSGGVIKDKKTLILATNLAVNYLNNVMVDTAETLGLEILEKSRQFGNTKTTTQILNHLANIAVKKGEYEKGIDYANEVIGYEGVLKHNQTFSSIYAYRGIAHLRSGRSKLAVADLEKGLEYATIDSSLQRQEMNLRYLQEAYAKLGRYEDAYRALLRFKEVADTLASEDNIRILNDIDTKYQTEKKEQQLRELNIENQVAELKIRQRNIWIIVVVVLAFVGAGFLFFISRQRILKEQQESLENRLVSLRVQLNPHFIFNALTAVQNYMLSGKDLREATRYLSNFAKVMRAFLEYNQEEEISLDKELYALELYVGIQKLRFSNGFEFNVVMDDDMVPEEVLVPPMIMQPLIENAIEHGIRNVENGTIELSYKLKGTDLVIRVSDNGVGRDKAAESPKVKDKTSLATKITAERISLLNRKGRGKYSFELKNNESGVGTTAIFTMPYTQI